MGRAHEVRAAAMAKTAAMKTKIYSRFGKEVYMAAKSGVPDPDMNLTLKRKIAEAKANQVPSDVIKRAIAKAAGGADENYIECRYEGFGPGTATIIVDCLTDNTNRTVSAVKTCFNKSHCKVGVSGSVSFNYDNCGVLVFPYTDEEGMLDALIMGEVDVKDIQVEDDMMTVFTAPTDFHKAQEVIEQLIPDCKFEVSEIQMIPNETTTLTSDEDKEMWNRLITMLNEVEDVQKLFHNVVEE